MLVVVAVFGGVLGGASAAAQDVERPGRGERLDNVIVTAGETIEVDISVGFTGTVETYAATSGDATVATVSVSGSVVSITGVSVGYAFVTVTATNAGGSRSQWFEVTVTAPPAPTLRYQLGAHATTIDAVVAFDLTPVFDGVVTSYAATSSDATILDASADESILVLRGVAAGAVTVTVTAHNGPGSTSVTFPVTVGAFAPPRVAAPQTAGALDAQEVPAGATTTIDVTGAFAGTIDDYVPITADGAIVAANRPHLGIIELAGVAAGTTTVRIVAINTGGIAAQTLTVTVTEPTLPEITATAPTHCLTGEGTPVTVGANTGREGIATIDIAYTVTGGIGPFVITNDANNITTTAPTGTINVTCARPGIDIHNVAPTVNAVESGPKTITLTVTDNNTDTATTDVTIEIVEDAYTTEYNDEIMQAGNTYVLGTPDQWTLITLPTGLNLEFDGISDIGDNGAAHFIDTISGSEIVLDWGTGAEIYRDITTTSTTGSDTGTRNSTTTRNIDSLLNTFRDSATTPAGVAYPRSTYIDPWQPYEGLPPVSGKVAVHPYMLEGKPIKVCNQATRGDFDSPMAFEGFNRAFSNAINAWNAPLHMRSAPERGTPQKVFDAGPTIVCEENSFDIFVYRDLNTPRCASGRLACSTTKKQGYRPPMIGGGDPGHFPIYVVLPDEFWLDFEPILIHELGHYLGLGDYGTFLIQCSTDAEKSIMAYPVRAYDSYGTHIGYEPGACGSDSVTTRDMEDVHATYHPDEMRIPSLEKNDSWEIRGVVAEAVNGRLEYNAHRLVVWRRPLGSVDNNTYRYVNAFEMGSDEVPGVVKIGLDFDATGWDFLVAGVTRGDWKRRTTDGGLPVEWIVHADVTSAELGNASWAMSRSWTLGHSVRLEGPPAAPRPVSASVDGPVVAVSWDAVDGADGYKIYWSRNAFTAPTGAPNSMELSGDVTNWEVPDLVGGRDYYFGVTALSGFHDNATGEHESSLSRQIQVRVGLAAPGNLRATGVGEDSFLALWGAVLGADRYFVRLDGGAAADLGNVAFKSFAGLEAGREYVVEVQAGYGSVRSDWSAELRVMTDSSAGAPEPPGNVAAVELSVGSARLSWDESDGATSYSVRWSRLLVRALFGGFATVRPPPLWHDFGGLAPSTTYELQVQAVNGAGASAWVAASLETSPQPVPSGLTVGAVTAGAVALSWAAVNPATGYEIRVDGDEIISDLDEVTAHRVTGLEPATPYTFEVRSVNGAYASDWSGDVPATTANLRAPTGVSVGSVTSTSVALTWVAVVAATSYDVRVDGDDEIITDVGGVTSYSVSGLLADTGYDFEVRARHGTHTSGWSSMVGARTAASTPGPSGLTVGAVTVNSVALRWNAVSAATGYEVCCDAFGRIIDVGNTTAFTVRGLEPAGDYDFEVRWLNGTTTSDWSDEVPATTANLSAPTGVSVGTVTVDSVALRWNSVVAATGYDVCCDAFNRTIEGITATSYTITGLAENREYEFEVRATRGALTSSWSVTVEATTDPAGPPPPSNVAVSTTHDSATLSWDAVAGASGYRVRQGTSGPGIYKPGASNTSQLFSDLSADTPYTFAVQTVSTAGSSAWVPRTARTDPPPPPPQLTGRAQIQRMTPTPVGGWTLNLTFYLNDHGDIDPELRFTTLDHLDVRWQYTSPVIATINGENRTLGRVAYRKTTATGDRIEIGFQPSGGSLITPPVRGINYSNMILWHTYQTSEFTFTLPDAAAARADSDANYAGRLAGGLAPGDEICTTCDAGTGDLEPMTDTDPQPKDS